MWRCRFVLMAPPHWQSAMLRRSAQLDTGTPSQTRLATRDTVPFVQKQPNATHSTALSMSASGNTNTGDLPPSSKDTARTSGAHIPMIRAPVATLPVKATFATPVLGHRE